MTGKNTQDTKGAWQATYDNKVVLHWDENTSQQTVQLDPLSNVSTIRLALGNKAFWIYKAMMDARGGESDPICFNANIVDDNNEAVGTPKVDNSDNTTLPASNTASDRTATTPSNHPDAELPPPVDFGDIKGVPVAIEGQDNLEYAMTPTAELLRTHYQLSHLSFVTIQAMARQGDLPSQLVDCRIPKCTSLCLYGKATKRPWQNKPTSKFESKIRIATKPGEVISVDQLESPASALYGQLKGAATGKRHHAATIFVDHYSRFSYRGKCAL